MPIDITLKTIAIYQALLKGLPKCLVHREQFNQYLNITIRLCNSKTLQKEQTNCLNIAQPTKLYEINIIIFLQLGHYYLRQECDKFYTIIYYSNYHIEQHHCPFYSTVTLIIQG